MFPTIREIMHNILVKVIIHFWYYDTLDTIRSLLFSKAIQNWLFSFIKATSSWDQWQVAHRYLLNMRIFRAVPFLCGWGWNLSQFWDYLKFIIMKVIISYYKLYEWNNPSKIKFLHVCTYEIILILSLGSQETVIFPHLRFHYLGIAKKY